MIPVVDLGIRKICLFFRRVERTAIKEDIMKVVCIDTNFTNKLGGAPTLKLEEPLEYGILRFNIKKFVVFQIIPYWKLII